MKSFIEWFLKWRRASKKPSDNTPIKNLPKPTTGYVDLNFKVTDLFHRNYKFTATYKGMTMKELMEASFEAWLQKNGDDKLRAMNKTIMVRK